MCPVPLKEAQDCTAVEQNEYVFGQEQIHSTSLELEYVVRWKHLGKR